MPLVEYNNIFYYIGALRFDAAILIHFAIVNIFKRLEIQFWTCVQLLFNRKQRHAVMGNVARRNNSLLFAFDASTDIF